MDKFAVDGSCGANLMSDKGSLQVVGVTSDEKGLQKLESAMKLLSRIEMDVAYTSEKLVNLHLLLLHVWTLDTDLEAVIADNSISADAMDKALVFDLLSGILDSEIKEVESFMDTLQKEVVSTHQNISLCRDYKELFTIILDKLHDSEESLKRSQDQVLEVKMQSAKMQQAFASFRPENWKNDNPVGISGNGQLLNIKVKANAEQRHILRMLEKSLARELDLEKKISELQQSEEELKVKLHYTGQVAFHMEETAEVVWGRFLEAENSSEVLMGISKELMNKLQLAHFNLNSSVQREAEVQIKLQECFEQVKDKESALNKIERRNEEYVALNAEMVATKEKVRILEKKLKESERQLENANALNEGSQEQLVEMENLIESLKDTVMLAESKAVDAEAKIVQLTESNMELTDELNFFKGRDSDRTKMSLLEKQARGLEIQLQNAKASAEASQEQQNMLYSAIWDMENLIEDFKSKLTKAEAKTDITEENCVMLSETNCELNQEISFLRTNLESMEKSLDQAKSKNISSSKEIDAKTKLITDLVRQLTKERERIQKQVHSLTEENKLLKKLMGNKNEASMISDGDDAEEYIFRKSSETADSFPKSFQVDEASKDCPGSDVGDQSSSFVCNGTSKDAKIVNTSQLNFINILTAISVALFSVLLIFLWYQLQA